MNISLATGPVPILVLGLGVLALVWLCWGNRRYLTRTVPLALLGGALGAVVLFVLAEYLLFWWDASFPRYLYIYSALGIFGILLAVPRFRRSRRIVGKAATVTAAALVLLAAASAANSAYLQYPTIGSIFEQPGAGAGEVPKRAPSSTAGLPASTAANWQPPSDMPSGGTVYTADIPESGSGYTSGPALVYLPPAYLASPPAVDLPVLVLLHGQPGGPSDWFIGGQLLQVMDDFAAQHQGLAPVVLIPDLSGGGAADWPLCLDSNLSRSATYLAVDLPAWTRENLASGMESPHQWAAAGYSYGGTCALQLAVNFPGSYPTFIDIAGENAPTIPGGRQALIDKYFGGDSARFADQDALEKLGRQKFTDSAGIVVIGQDDTVYAPEGRQMYDAAKAAGMDVQLQVLPGGHSWQVWKTGLSANLEWLSTRLGILGQ